jgi:hypothetical protein
MQTLRIDFHRLMPFIRNLDWRFNPALRPGTLGNCVEHPPRRAFALRQSYFAFSDG